MAWTSENWKQDESEFYGYPIPVSAVSVPEPPHNLDFNTPWIFDDVFYGCPHHKSNSLKPETPHNLDFKTPWIFDDVFYGYPHVTNLINNPVSLMLGSIPVQSAYLGKELIWKRGGINRIITGNLVRSE